MSLTIVQANSKTIYLRFWKLEITPGKKPQWIYKDSLIPYETEDTRFRRSCDLLAEGWRFYLAKADPRKGDKPVVIPVALLQEIANDPPAYVESPYAAIDFSQHWREVDRKYEEAQKQPKGVALTAQNGIARLVADYKAGKRLKPFQMVMIKDLI